MNNSLSTIDPNQIIINDRQRKIFDPAALTELKESILQHGLFHAPGIVSLQDPTLSFGERRVRVLSQILEEGKTFDYNGSTYTNNIPIVEIGNRSLLELQEIELSENLARRDLTWQEKARALSDLESLRQQQREAQGDKRITLEELAQETKQTPANVSNILALAKHLDDPDVQKAKTAKDAKKIIERKAKEQQASLRSLAFDPSRSQHTFIEGDCREVIKTLPDSKFSVILSDPPYGIEMDKDQSWDGTWHEYDDSEAYALNLIQSLLPEWDRVSQDQAHLYLFCDFSKFELLFQIIQEHGVFEPMHYPFIWNKGNVASYPRAEHWPRKSFECILYAIKGDKPHNKLDLAVIDIPQLQHHDHPAGKPWELYRHLLNRSVLAGDQVLDCFAGGGPIFRAAMAANVIATGIELSDKYATLARNTLTDIGE